MVELRKTTRDGYCDTTCIWVETIPRASGCRGSFIKNMDSKTDNYVIIIQPTMDGNEIHVATNDHTQHRSQLKMIIKKIVKIVYYFLLLGL